MICRVAGGLWFCCFQFFLAEQIARLGWTGHYSMARNYISDLGSAQCSLHWLMNSSFVLQGLLIFFGAVLMTKCFPTRLVYRIALLLFAVAGVGVLVVGLVPEDTNAQLHVAGAAAHFLGGDLAMIFVGLVLIRLPPGGMAGKGSGWVTFAAGAVGLLATIAIGFRGTPSWTALGWDAGTVERLAAYPLPLWLTWTGYRFLRGTRWRITTPNKS
jgi:hypothetical membrane protein